MPLTVLYHFDPNTGQNVGTYTDLNSWVSTNAGAGWTFEKMYEWQLKLEEEKRATARKTLLEREGW